MRRAGVGAAGEDIAAWWLGTQGLLVTRTNVEVTGGEIDLIAFDGPTRVVVEVRAITGAGDPIDAISTSKRAHVRRLAGHVGAGRVDFLGVAIRDRSLDLHWVPG